LSVTELGPPRSGRPWRRGTRASSSLVVATLAALALASAADAGSNVVSLNVDRTAISTALGRKFVLRTTIANHGTTPLQAVNAGSIGVYVAVLRQSGAAKSPVTAWTMRASIARRTTLNAGDGALPDRCTVCLQRLAPPRVLCLSSGVRVRSQIVVRLM
jgi:hypothetical protein